MSDTYNLKQYGVDVSTWQGVIDWAKVKAAGKTFAIIRAGYGQNNIDDKAIDNVRGAVAAGLRVGLYWFSYPKSDANNARKEGEYAVAFAKLFNVPYIGIFYDIEGGNEGVQTREFVQQCAINFCVAVRNGGYPTGVYYNLDYNTRYFGNDFWKRYPWMLRWFAYPDSGSTSQTYDFWQYSFKGKVDGITGDVDLNVTNKLPDPTPDPGAIKYFLLRRRRRRGAYIYG